MIKIKVENYIKRFIEKCIKENITIYDIEYHDKFIICLINYKDLKIIKRKNYYSKITLIKELGKKGIINHLKKYLFDYLILLISILFLYLISNIVFCIEIKHENKILKEEINEILTKKGIKKFSIKKDIRTLNKISESIISENKDTIEWISINAIGTKYVIAVEERISNSKKKEKDFCHIISNHNSTVTKIVTSKGITLVEKGSKVNNNDILISGEIKLNDEIKDNVCANGLVYGEVWYKVNITQPLNYKIKKYTNNNRYNLVMNGNYLRKQKFNKYDENKIIKIGNFKLIKEKEYKIIDKSYSYEDAKKLAIKKAGEELLKKTGNNSTILTEKVLKETKNNSKIELEIFISIEQLIGKQIEYKVSDVNDTE